MFRMEILPVWKTSLRKACRKIEKASSDMQNCNFDECVVTLAVPGLDALEVVQCLEKKKKEAARCGREDITA